MNISKEIWKPIEGYPYSISNLGRVRRETEEANTYTGKILSTRTDSSGYKVVTLFNDGFRVDKKVHQLICTYFNGPKPSHKSVVRHLDGNRSNNNPSNLKWGTPKENSDDRELHGRTPKGDEHCKALFTNAEVRRMRREYRKAKIEYGKKYVPRGFVQKMAASLGVNRFVLGNVLSGNGYR